MASSTGTQRKRRTYVNELDSIWAIQELVETDLLKTRNWVRIQSSYFDFYRLKDELKWKRKTFPHKKFRLVKELERTFNFFI